MQTTLRRNTENIGHQVWKPEASRFPRSAKHAKRGEDWRDTTVQVATHLAEASAWRMVTGETENI